MVNKVLGHHSSNWLVPLEWIQGFAGSILYVHCISAALSRPNEGSSIMCEVSSIALPAFDLRAVEPSMHLVAFCLLRSFMLREQVCSLYQAVYSLGRSSLLFNTEPGLMAQSPW